MEKTVQFPVKKDAPAKKKPRNMTSDGRRCVRVDAGYDPKTGKRIRKAFYGKTLKEAQQKANEYKQALALGIDVGSQSQTVSRWIDTWLDTYGQRAGYSVNTYTAIYAEKLRTSLGKVKLIDVRQAHIQRFADSVSDYSKSSVSKIRVATQQIFRAAIANRIIPIDPCLDVRWTHAGEGTHRRLDEAEVLAVMKHWSVYRAGLWAMLMFFAGLRRGEALALTWDDVDLGTDVIHVRSGVHFEVNARVLGDPKTATSVRDIPILPPLHTALTTTPRLSPKWVCTGAQGQPVTQSIWASSWRTWLNTMTRLLNSDTAPENIVPFDVRAHDLRHTYPPCFTTQM